MKKLILVVMAIVSLVNISSAQSQNGVVTNYSAERFKIIIANDKNGVLIDLRTTEELEKKGYIKGAIQLDYLAKDSEKEIDKLDKNKTYYIYCAGGGRSSEAAAYMEKSGFKKIVTLEKGLSEWLQKGYPVEKK